MKDVNIGGRQFGQLDWWWKYPSLRALYWRVAVVWLSSATGGFDGSMMNGLQSLIWWNTYFHNPTLATLGLMNAIVPAGNFLVNLFVPYMADTFGRKKTLFIGLAVLFTGIAIQSASVNIGMFIVSRFIGGVGAAMGTGPYLISEIAHPQHRPTVTAMYNTCYYIGAIIAAWTTYGTLTLQSNWAWRLPSILQFVTPVIQFSLLWFVPESPRWLVNNDRPDEARAILQRFHGPCLGDENSMRFRQQAVLRRNFKTRAGRNCTPPRVTDIVLQYVSVWDSSRTPVEMLFSVTNYLHQVLNSIGITDSRKQLTINGTISIYNWVFALGVTFFLDKVGRRPLFLISVGGMFCCFITWTVFSALYQEHHSPAMAKGVLAMIFLYTSFYNIGWSGLYHAYAVEILPYNIRAKGCAVMVLCAYSAVFFANYVNPIGLPNIHWKYYIVYDCWLAVIFTVIYFRWVETKNTPLEEIAKFFDGEDALVGGGLEMSKREKEMFEAKGDIEIEVVQAEDVHPGIKV